MTRMAPRQRSYGMPSAAGGRERPTRPATAISVSTYGSAWNSVAADGENAGSRCASAIGEAEQQARAERAAGRPLPKITAASAMKPRPVVMFSLNAWTKPIDRNAPPSEASTPERMTPRSARG